MKPVEINADHINQALDYNIQLASSPAHQYGHTKMISFNCLAQVYCVELFLNSGMVKFKLTQDQAQAIELFNEW